MLTTIGVRGSFTDEAISARLVAHGTVTPLNPLEVGMLHDSVHGPVPDEAGSVSIPWPPLSGSGSDRETWVAFAREIAKGNEEAWEVVDEQSVRIASLEAEVVQLRAQLAESSVAGRVPAGHQPAPVLPAAAEPAALQPKGGQRKTSEAAREAIRADLAAGLSQSEAARRNGVSAMTVSRLVRST